MRQPIREYLEKKREELNMSTTPPVAAVSFTPGQLQQMLATVVASAIAESKKLNPIEQRKLEEELAADKRRTEMVKQLGMIEEEAMRKKKGACSHTADARTGDARPKGAYGAAWTTSGQVHGNDCISLICLRCGTTWCFKATAAERDYAQNAEHGLLGFAPPPDERLLKDTEVAVA